VRLSLLHAQGVADRPEIDGLEGDAFQRGGDEALHERLPKQEQQGRSKQGNTRESESSNNNIANAHVAAAEIAEHLAGSPNGLQT